MSAADDIKARLAAAASKVKGAAGNAASATKEEIAARLAAKAEPNPMAGIEYGDDLETDTAKEISAVAKGFRDRAARDQERYLLAVDTEFWFAVCFHTRAEKDLFLARAGLDGLGDKYLDGPALARRLGIDLSPTKEG